MFLDNLNMIITQIKCLAEPNSGQNQQCLSSLFVLSECLFTISANSPPCWQRLVGGTNVC